MKFNIIKDEIFNLLKLLNNITYNDINKINENNILISVEDNILKIIGNNSELEINLSYKLKNYSESGLVFVSYKKILNICKLIPNKTDIFFFKKDNFLFIKTDISIFSLSSLEIKNLNLFDTNNKIFELCLYSNNILNLLKQTYFSISIQDIRNYLNGMLFCINNNEIKVITTDGHRLSLSSININNNIKYNFMLYRKSIIELIKFLENNLNKNILLKIYNKFIKISIDNFIFISRLFNEEFPNCKNIINKKNKYSVLINRINFKNSINRVSSILEEKTYLIKIKFCTNKLIILAENINFEFSKEIHEIKYNDLDIEIGINYNYLINVLCVLDSEFIILSFSDTISSIDIVEKDNKNKKYVIMPIKI